MNPDVLVALLTGTGVATLISIIYRIIRERRGNAQRDIAGDLTLGEVFREVARREVLTVQGELDEMRVAMATLRDLADAQAEEIRTMRRHIMICERNCEILLEHWPNGIKPPPNLETV